MLDRNLLCCGSLTTDSHFIVKELTSCNNTRATLKMKYTVNGAISAFFNTSYLNIDVKTLYDSVPNEVTHILKFERTEVDNLLLEDSSIPIDLHRLAKLVCNNNSVYFSKNDKLHNKNDF